MSLFRPYSRITAVRSPLTRSPQRHLVQRAICTPQAPLTTLQSASMASSSNPPQKQEYLVILPDQPGALQKRQQVRPDHLANLKPKTEGGFWTFGGAFFDEHPPAGQAPDVKGSVMLAYAESREQVIEELKRDIYNTGGVWNWDKVQVYAFRSALRRGMEGGL